MIKPLLERPSSILIVCTRNQIRSVMAEALLKKEIGFQSYIDSVGVNPADEPNGFTLEIMQEIGFDLSRHKGKSFLDLHDESFDLAIVLSEEALQETQKYCTDKACHILYWDIPDPSIYEGSREQSLQAYRETRTLLKKRIQDFALSFSFSKGENPQAKETET